jgi:hypothetical protein
MRKSKQHISRRIDIQVVLIMMTVLLSSVGFAQVWEELSAPPFPGRHHGIGFSHEGFGYVVSGSDSRDVWKYTPETDSWEQLADYSSAYRGYGIGGMADGIGYFGFGFVQGGGQSGYADDLWAFDGATESFTQLADCPCEPRLHPALIAFEDKVYMGLGSGVGGNLGDWWEYDVTSNSWTEKATFIGANRHHPYQFKIGDYIYVGSGHQSDWYRYEPAADSWTQVESHPSYVRVAGIQFAYGGKGYTLSGVADYNGDNHQPMPTGEFWEYDPLEDAWTELPPHPGLSRWASASFIIDGWIYMVAGQVYDGETSVYRYQLGDTPTGVEDNSATEPLSLRPMPFVDHIELPARGSWISATIFDIRGSIVSVPVFEGKTLRVDALPNGIYVLELKDNETIVRQRIVRE